MSCIGIWIFRFLSNLALKQCRAIHAPRRTGAPRESCKAPRKISGIYKSTIFLTFTNSLDSVKSHFQTKKFELRRESLKNILVRRGWKKSARHCSKAIVIKKVVLKFGLYSEK